MRGSATLAIVVSSADMIDASMTDTVMSARRGPSISAIRGAALLNVTPYLWTWVRWRRRVRGRANAYRRSRWHSGPPAIEIRHRPGSAEDERARAGRL